MRPVDDLTRCVHVVSRRVKHHCVLRICFACRSGCNAATETLEKLSYESIDAFLAVIREMGAVIGRELEPWKADIDSAFRRIPVRPDHREFSHITFRCRDQVVIAKHLASPFGAVSSVHHWERIGL